MRRDLPAFTNVDPRFRSESDDISTEILIRHSKILSDSSIVTLSEKPGGNYVVTPMYLPIRSIRHINCSLLVSIKGDRMLAYHFYPDSRSCEIRASNIFSDFNPNALVHCYFQENPYREYHQENILEYTDQRFSRLIYLQKIFAETKLDLAMVPIKNFRSIQGYVDEGFTAFSATMISGTVCFWNYQTGKFLTSHEYLGKEG